MVNWPGRKSWIVTNEIPNLSRGSLAHLSFTLMYYLVKKVKYSVSLCAACNLEAYALY